MADNDDNNINDPPPPADAETGMEKPLEDTDKTTADSTGGGGGGDNVGASLIIPTKTGDDSPHDHALTVSSRRDLQDTRTQPFVVIVAVAAALGGLIFVFGALTILIPKKGLHISFDSK